MVREAITDQSDDSEAFTLSEVLEAFPGATLAEAEAVEEEQSDTSEFEEPTARERFEMETFLGEYRRDDVPPFNPDRFTQITTTTDETETNQSAETRPDQSQIDF